MFLLLYFIVFVGMFVFCNKIVINPFFRTFKKRLQFSNSSASAASQNDSTMFKSKPTNLEKASPAELKAFFGSFDTVLFDCDGVLWIENDEIPGSAKTVSKLKEIGKQVFYVTNNSTKIRSEFAEKANTMGFYANTGDILSTAFLAAHYLKSKNFQKKVYIVGTSGIAGELEAVGIKSMGVGPDPVKPDYKSMKMSDLDPEVGAVVVGFDEHVSYPKFMKAASYLCDPKCLFIATNTDERFPRASGVVIPGAGTIVRAVETCAERKAIVLGKPHEYVITYLATMNIIPERTLMVGDRCNTDIELGVRAGYQTLLVLSGVTSEQDLEQRVAKNILPIPDFYVSKLGGLAHLFPDTSCWC